MTRQLLSKAISVAILVAGFSAAPFSMINAQEDASTNENERVYGDNKHSEKKHSDRQHRGRSDFGKSDPNRRIERMTRHLDLDETQSQTLNNIVSAAEPELRQLQNSLQGNRDALRALDPNEPDYDTDLQNLATSAGDQATQLALLMGRIRADVNSVLTPQQREQLQQQVEQFRGRGHRGNGRAEGEEAED